jgi:cobalt-zinc-cadmium resistance protein CzcA
MATTVLLALAGAFVLSLTVVPVLTSYSCASAGAPRDVAAAEGASRSTWPALQAGDDAAHVYGGRRIGLACSRSRVCSSVGSGPSSFPSSTRATCSSRRAACRASHSPSRCGPTSTLPRRSRRFPRSITSSAAPGAPEVATDPMGLEQSDVYVGSSRETWRPGLTASRHREGDRRGSRRPPRDRRRRLAAHPDAHQRAGRGHPLRRRRAPLRAGPLGAARLGRSVRRRSPQGAGCRRRARRAGRRACATSASSPTGTASRATASPSKTSTSSPRRWRSATTVGDVLEGERRFAIVVQGSPRLRRETSSPSGRCRSFGERARWCPGRRRRLEFVTGPAQVSREGQSRRLTVEFNVRGRDLLSVVKEAKLLAARDGGLPCRLSGRVGRPVRALPRGPRAGSRSWCRWRWR